MRCLLAHPLARAAAALVAGLCLLATAAPAAAAKPPAGRTYFTTFNGVDEPYETSAECLIFEEAGLCAADGELCGLWLRRDNSGKETGFSFELSLRHEGGGAVFEGQARLDSRGAQSSIAGAGRLSGSGQRQNVSFAGREVETDRCLELLAEAEDETVVDDSGNLVTESREVADFTGVVLNTVGRVVIRHTGSESLAITTDEDLLPHLTSEVRGGRLILGREPGFSFDTETEILFEVTVIELDEIAVSGVGTVEATGIDAELFTVDIEGVAVVSAEGSADRQAVEISGVSAYRAKELGSRVVDIDVLGVSVASVRVSDELSGRVAGVSTLEYIGNPVVNVTVEPGSQLIQVAD